MGKGTGSGKLIQAVGAERWAALDLESRDMAENGMFNLAPDPSCVSPPRNVLPITTITRARQTADAATLANGGPNAAVSYRGAADDNADHDDTDDGTDDDDADDDDDAMPALKPIAKSKPTLWGKRAGKGGAASITAVGALAGVVAAAAAAHADALARSAAVAPAHAPSSAADSARSESPLIAAPIVTTSLPAVGKVNAWKRAMAGGDGAGAGAAADASKQKRDRKHEKRAKKQEKKLRKAKKAISSTHDSRKQSISGPVRYAAGAAKHAGAATKGKRVAKLQIGGPTNFVHSASGGSGFSKVGSADLTTVGLVVPATIIIPAAPAVPLAAAVESEEAVGYLDVVPSDQSNDAAPHLRLEQARAEANAAADAFGTIASAMRTAGINGQDAGSSFEKENPPSQTSIENMPKTAALPAAAKLFQQPQVQSSAPRTPLSLVNLADASGGNPAAL